MFSRGGARSIPRTRSPFVASGNRDNFSIVANSFSNDRSGRNGPAIIIAQGKREDIHAIFDTLEETFNKNCNQKRVKLIPRKMSEGHYILSSVVWPAQSNTLYAASVAP